jgi:hypothetical protein
MRTMKAKINKLFRLNQWNLSKNRNKFKTEKLWSKWKYNDRSSKFKQKILSIP